MNRLWTAAVMVFGVGMLCFTAGCPASPPAKPTAQSAGGGPDHTGESAAEHAAHEHAHPTEGPHHGHLIELGNEEYHAELTHDEATDTVTVYILDNRATGAVAIAEPELTINLVVGGKPAQYELPAAPQADDPEGKSSRFELKDAELHEGLEAESAKGRINLTIEGKSYSGEIQHEAHGEHEHEEEHDHK